MRAAISKRKLNEYVCIMNAITYTSKPYGDAAVSPRRCYIARGDCEKTTIKAPVCFLFVCVLLSVWLPFCTTPRR